MSFSERKSNQKINENLRFFFNVHASFTDRSKKYSYLEIENTKTYIMAFFHEQKIKSMDFFQNAIWDWISEDKVFLNKFDEIMNILTTK